MNIIGIKSRLPAVTEKDMENLRFAVRQDMDFVAASFVRKPEDILEIRQILLAEGSHMHIIAKIEDREGVENIDGIIRVADGIMVARGDLGVQLATEEMPLVQKRIILKCHDQNKAVITATQMLDSMIHNPRPTRAEATDVANAIFDGSDAVMLSGETASGKYPVAAVQVMDSIARTVEASPEYESRVRRFFRLDDIGEDIAQAVTRSAFLVAREIRAIGHHRPDPPRQHAAADQQVPPLAAHHRRHPVGRGPAAAAPVLGRPAPAVRPRGQLGHDGEQRPGGGHGEGPGEDVRQGGDRRRACRCTPPSC